MHTQRLEREAETDLHYSKIGAGRCCQCGWKPGSTIVLAEQDPDLSISLRSRVDDVG